MTVPVFKSFSICRHSSEFFRKIRQILLFRLKIAGSKKNGEKWYLEVEAGVSDSRVIVEPLSAIVGFINLCNSMIALAKHFPQSHLSTEEERILASAGHHGIVELVRHKELLTVWGDGRLFQDDREPAERIRYLSAFRRLCETGQIYPEGDTRFTFSREALERGRTLLGDRFDRARTAKEYLPYIPPRVREVLLVLAKHLDHPYLFVLRTRGGVELSVSSEGVFDEDMPDRTEICETLLLDLLDLGYVEIAVDGEAMPFTRRSLRLAAQLAERE